MFAFPIRRILVPVDLSAASALAYDAALLIAARFEARVEVVFCEAPPPPEFGLFGPVGLPRSRTRLAARLKRRYPRADARHVLRGEPERMLAKLLAARRHDLVVMGTHGRTGLARAILGSVTESMLRDSPVPVLSLRRGFRLPRRVLAPIRPDDGSTAALLAAGLMAQAFKAKLDVLQVIPGGSSLSRSKDQLMDQIRLLPQDVRRDVKPRLEIRRGDAIEQILRAARRRDLVVLMSRRKSLLGDLMLGTTAERVSRYAPVPVLCMPGPGRRRGPVLI